MDERKDPHEAGTGNLLEIVDMMCDVVERMSGIVRKQAVLIEQEKITRMIFSDDLSKETDLVETDLDKIEMKLRRI